MAWGSNGPARPTSEEYAEKLPKIDWSNSPNNIKKDKEECSKKSSTKSSK